MDYSYCSFLFCSTADANLLLEIAQKKYGKFLGKEVVFVEKDESLQKYGYSFYYYDESRKDLSYRKLPYEDYKNKRGEITKIVLFDYYGRNQTFLELRLETGEIFYIRETQVSDNYIENLFFIDDYNEALKKVGKSIWINQNASLSGQKLITENETLSYPLKHIEEVKVIGILTKQLGHSYGIKPFFLKVQKMSGEVGYIGYNPQNYFEKNPIKPHWNETFVKAIKDQKVLIGMTKEQVLISWGNPEKINRTVVKNKTFEQWIYGDLGPYLYFEDGKLVGFQD